MGSVTLTHKPLQGKHRIIRFLVSCKNLPEKWHHNTNNDNNSNYGLCSCPRFSILTHYRSHSLCPFLSVCSPPLLPPPPLRPLFKPRSPPLRHPFSSMRTSDTDPPLQSSTKTVRVIIKGRVQGVFYRNWTVENATQLGLKGWVRNRRDGSVEALFCGDSDKVQEMEQSCRRGPPNAMVTTLQVFPSDEDPGTGFQRKSTV